MRSRKAIFVTGACVLLGWVGAANAQSTAPASSTTERAVLRIACDGANIGAQVTINDVYKGDCPFDTQIAAGPVRVTAVKAGGEFQESIFGQTFYLGAGVMKRVEIELSAPQFTDEGLIRERQQLFDAMVAERRNRNGSAGSPCPDCPPELTDARKAEAVSLIEVPTSAAPEIQVLLDRGKQELLRYIGGGAAARPPANAMPLPCESAQAAMRDLAAMPAAKVRARDATQTYFRDVRIWPIQATCVAGLLEGPLEFWAVGNSVGARNDFDPVTRMRTDGFMMAGAVLVRVQAVMVEGKATGMIAKMEHTGQQASNHYQYKDNVWKSDFNRQPNNKFVISHNSAVRSDKETIVSISLTLNDNPAPKMKTLTSVKYTDSAGRPANLTYRGAMPF